MIKEAQINVKKENNKRKDQVEENICIDLTPSSKLHEGGKENTQNNFNSIFKQIIDTNNEHFLKGDLNIIDYLISKFSNTPIKPDDIKKLKKLSIKITSEFDILNQFGLNLPLLDELTLNGSIISNVEDLGSSFKNLTILNVSNCFLENLCGKLTN